MKKMKCARAALALLVISGATVCSAADRAVEEAIARAMANPTLPPGSWSFKAMDRVTPATSGVVLATDISVGFTQPGVPCYQCDPLGGYTIATPIPEALLTSGAAITYTFQFQDLSYSGSCTAAFVLLQGQTVLQSGTAPGLNCQAGTVNYVTWSGGAPSASGAASMIGLLVYDSPVRKTVLAKTIYLTPGA